MDRMLGHAEKVEASLSPTKDLDSAKARVTELEAQVEKDKATIAALEGQVKDLQAKADKAGADATAATTEVTTLKAALEEEKTRVDQTLAAMGADPKSIPAAPPGKPSASTSAGEKLIAELNALQNSHERTLFYRKNKAAIDAAYAARD